ncbi:hypothetical protein Tsubulata_019565 [Turnera subulata]|uniref:F-box associated beta-propeller type 1 domain-containing protein n=1 Tax=Turnera subulata TaxID=218843 RepID=A0A9Q0JLH5_9ROSI|nr:hypothetical protein Tsubulata_019565 [Turnera subulata]
MSTSRASNGQESSDDHNRLLAGLERLYYSFVGSCNGLVCVDVSDRYEADKWETIVWNPFTCICRKLPLRNYYAYGYFYGFGYDSASDDYKVFAVTDIDPGNGDCEFENIPLKSGSWKEVENDDLETIL